MSAPRLFFFLLLFSFPLHTSGAVTAGDLPGDTIWYMHADLEAMRTTESGSKIYGWFEDEVVEEISEKTGINLSAEVNSITAYSDATNGTVVVVNGPMTKESQERLLAIATMEAGGDIDLLEHVLLSQG